MKPANSENDQLLALAVMKELGSMAGQEPLEYALHEIIARSQQLLSKGVDDLRPIKRHRRYGPIVEKHTSRIRELGKRYQALELNASDLNAPCCCGRSNQPLHLPHSYNQTIVKNATGIRPPRTRSHRNALKNGKERPWRVEMALVFKEPDFRTMQAFKHAKQPNLDTGYITYRPV